jgi:hypothetical protein
MQPRVTFATVKVLLNRLKTNSTSIVAEMLDIQEYNNRGGLQEDEEIYFS